MVCEVWPLIHTSMSITRITLPNKDFFLSPIYNSFIGCFCQVLICLNISLHPDVDIEQEGVQVEFTGGDVAVYCIGVCKRPGDIFEAPNLDEGGGNRP